MAFIEKRVHGQSVPMRWWEYILIASFVLVLLPVVLVWLGSMFLIGLCISLWFWVHRLINGKCILFVYSDSPHWKPYVEKNILPKIEQQSIILNWSERGTWPLIPTIPVLAFRFFGGRREFNPLAVIFLPFRWPKTLRFYHPIKQALVGDHDRTRLDELETVLFSSVVLKKAG